MFADITGMTKECLELIYSEVKEDSTDEDVEGFTKSQGWKDPGQVLEGLFNVISIFL